MNIPDVIVVRQEIHYTKDDLIRSLTFLGIEPSDANILYLADMWANEDFGDSENGYVLLDEDGNPLHA